MPIPTRNNGESHGQYVERCMADPEMIRECPDAAQRRAMCEARAGALLDVTGRAPLQLTCTMQIEAGAETADKPALPRFRMIAYTGGVMSLGGWRHPVVVDLAGLSIPSQNRPIRLGHDAGHGVGHTDSIRIDGGHLVATGVVSRDTAAAKEIVVSSRNGFPWQASIGASVGEAEFIKENQKTIVNGQEITGPVNVVRKATLGEISFVDLGADGRTSASVAATAGRQATDHRPQGSGTQAIDAGPQEMQMKITGQQQVETGAQQQVIGQTAPSVHPEPFSSQPDLAARMRAEAAAESARIAAIRRLCGSKFSEIEAQAIKDGWDATRCELEILRASRPAAPAIQSVSNPVTNTVLEAACAMSARLIQAEQTYDAQTLEAASKRFRGGIGLQELLLEAAWANGYTGRNFRDSREVLRCAFGRNVQAGFSTIDIGGILSNVSNKFLLEGFFSVERTWRNICAVRNVSDFKTVTSYRLVGKDQYEKIAPNGELKHGTLGEEKYTNKADTYGLILAVDRRDIINDDLGAITQVPRKLGRGSGLKINDVFWATFLDNAAFFTPANRNFLVGADTALGIDGLTKAETAFLEQVDSNGKPIGVMPAVLLLPPSLSAIGTQLNKSLEMRDTTTNIKYPIANPHQGKFRPEVSRYLSNSQYTGASNKAWYLLADANDLPVIEVAFLNGQEAPTIETAEADFNVLGIQLRGYSDFGISLQDPRGGIKAKGEA